MKPKNLLVGIVAITCLVTMTTFAQSIFNTAREEKIELETLKTDKKQFFDFLNETITTREPGLGSYGRVSASACDMTIEGMKIIDYKTSEGKEVRFLSNPSCNQIVLRKILENSYQYDKSTITAYHNRQCILALERIISPLLEYYTIKYEERANGECRTCEFKERERLDLIVDNQKKINQHCRSQSSRVMNFVKELDGLIESSYKTKTGK